MAPLINQLRLENQKNNNKKIIINKESLEAFNKIKEILSTYPIFRHAIYRKRFIIYADASGYAMGAILAPKDDMFANKRFNKHQELMPISLKECLSIMFGIEFFKDYIHDKQFTIIIDHKALIYLKNLKNNNQMLLRFSLLLLFWIVISSTKKAKLKPMSTHYPDSSKLNMKLFRQLQEVKLKLLKLKIQTVKIEIFQTLYKKTVL
jgi:hypothetical protein